MNKILIILFILTSSIGFSSGLYLEPINKHDTLVVQTIDDKIYINPNCIFYEDNTMLLQTDDNRYLPVVYFEKDDIGYYTLKAEKVLGTIGYDNFKKEMKIKLEVFNEKESRKKREIGSLQENDSYNSNLGKCFYFYDESGMPFEDFILCGETVVRGKISGSDENGKTEVAGDIGAVHSDTTKNGTEYEVSGSVGGKIDDDGNIDKKIEVEFKVKI